MKRFSAQSPEELVASLKKTFTGKESRLTRLGRSPGSGAEMAVIGKELKTLQWAVRVLDAALVQERIA